MSSAPNVYYVTSLNIEHFSSKHFFKLFEMHFCEPMKDEAKLVRGLGGRRFHDIGGGDVGLDDSFCEK